MATWSEFEAEEPDVAAAGRRLLWPEPFATSFLATVRGDGGPRVHPVIPVLALGRIHVFVVEMSPKYDDLMRDGRYALHALPPPGGGEEFYLTGRATFIDHPEVRAAVRDVSGGLGGHDFERLFALELHRVLHTRWSNWGTADTWPEYDRWRVAG